MSLPARIESKIARVPFCGCWIWIGSGERYGTVWLDGKLHRAHRAVFTLTGRDLPADLELMHTCDIGVCVNPDHMVIGTHRDNMEDMARKGRARAPSGEQHWTRHDTKRARLIAQRNIVRTHHAGAMNNNAKGSSEVAAQIRAAHAANPRTTMADLGLQFGLGREQTRKIVKEIAWKP